MRIILTLYLFLLGSFIFADERPNIILAMADDWSWPHASAYGDCGVKTPVFDSIADGGVLFTNAYVSSPSCTPSRGAVLSGQWHWRLKENCNLWSTIRKEVPLYTDRLAASGYHVGYIRKAWGPGNYKAGGRASDPSGKQFKSFEAFLKKRKKGQPFCFWFGSSDPHRPYDEGSGIESGIKLDSIKLFKCFLDSPIIRSDVADYFFEVQRFDRELGLILSKVKEIDEYENTIVIVTGDNGMPFPRCKGNLYDSGVRVPLTVSWGSKIKGGRTVTDFVSLIDLAPTMLEAAGLVIPPEMTGVSLMSQLKSAEEGRIDEKRYFTIFGRERHTPAQKYPSMEGYPSRGIRTDDFLYIINFKPDLWPVGVHKNSTRGAEFSDCDGSPTKSFIIKNRKNDHMSRYFKLCFAKRPQFELYDLKQDPDQLQNVANKPEYKNSIVKLHELLVKQLKASRDPRVCSVEPEFDTYRYYGRTKKLP